MMSVLWNSQPFSYWVLLGVLGVWVLSLGLLLWAAYRSGRNGRILAAVGTLLIALVVLAFPVSNGGAYCGRGADATGWVSPPSYGDGECRVLQWRVFWVGMLLLGLGAVSSVASLFACSQARLHQTAVNH